MTSRELKMLKLFLVVASFLGVLRYMLLKAMPFPGSQDNLPSSKSGKTVAILGGGPSSSVPLVASMLCSDSFHYFGAPWDSFIFKGRDPQKTILTLLGVAKKYQTFEHLHNATQLYYRYLMALSLYFKVDLAAAVDKSYNIAYESIPAGLDEEVLFYHKESDSFIPAKLARTATVSLFGTSSGEQVEIPLTPLEAITPPYLSYDLSIELTEPLSVQSSGQVLELNTGHHHFLFVPKLHASLHYFSVFFKQWQDPSLFQESDFDTVISRAGFEYPDDAVVRIMTALNCNYAQFAVQVLTRVGEQLNELQQSLLDVLQRFIEKNSKHRHELNSTPCFAVVGGGRAAGEVSRRLANDLIHKMAKNNQILGLKSIVDDEQLLFSAEELSLRKKLEQQRKEVVVVDHHRINLDEPDTLFTLMKKEAYRQFIFEITKFDFVLVPRLELESDVEYYSALYRKLQKMPVSEERDMLLEGLRKLLMQTNTLPTYIIRTQTNRDHGKWGSDFFNSLFSQVPNAESCSPDIKVLKVGGAFQTSIASHKGYKFLRIHDSHYRAENLPFLELYGRHYSQRGQTNEPQPTCDLIEKASNARI